MDSILQENNLDLPKLEKIITDWAKGKDLIQSIYLYGSRIRGNYRPDSDLDIAIEIIPDYGSDILSTWMEFSDIWKMELQELLPYKVHLQLLDDDSPTIQKGIDDSSVLVYVKG